jgi:hypothetical protein
MWVWGAAAAMCHMGALSERNAPTAASPAVGLCRITSLEAILIVSGPVNKGT